MTHFVCIFLVLVLVTISTVICEEPQHNNGKDGDFQCDKKNAIQTDCANKCDLNRCPVTEHYSRVCDKQQCAPGCKCRFNEKFDTNGTCILTQQCPPFRCGGNEQYVACPSYCSDSCSQRNCQAFGFILMVVECFPGCRCLEGFYRKDGICVPSVEC